MQDAMTVVVIMVFTVVAVVGYFYYKVIQFFLVSVNLYKKMVTRQDATVKLLLDIRNNTKTYTALIDEDDLNKDDDDEKESAEVADDFCYHCGEEITKHADQCTACGKKL